MPPSSSHSPSSDPTCEAPTPSTGIPGVGPVGIPGPRSTAGIRSAPSLGSPVPVPSSASHASDTVESPSSLPPPARCPRRSVSASASALAHPRWRERRCERDPADHGRDRHGRDRHGRDPHGRDPHGTRSSTPLPPDPPYTTPTRSANAIRTRSTKAISAPQIRLRSSAPLVSLLFSCATAAGFAPPSLSPGRQIQPRRRVRALRNLRTLRIGSRGAVACMASAQRQSRPVWWCMGIRSSGMWPVRTQDR